MSGYINLQSAGDLLKSLIPDAEWFLAQIESKQGNFRFPTYLSSVITNLKIEAYPLLYQNESAIGAIMFKGFMSDNEFTKLINDIEKATPEKRGQIILDSSNEVNQALDNFKIPKTQTEQIEADKIFNSLTLEQQQQSIKTSQHFFCSFFASFYQTLSIMVHGEKLTSLVAQAKAGDDSAFVKAVQIDKRILTAIPYFTERFNRASNDDKSDFFDQLSYRLQCAPYKGKIRHKSLWLAFSILDQLNLLDGLKHTQILEICDEAGVGGYENRIQSVKHLSNRLKEYREFQKRNVLSTI